MEAKRLPPVWLMGFVNLTIGISGGMALFLTPQLLEARHVPEPEIARLTSFGLFTLVAAFPFTPLLDVWFRRRTYVAIFNLASAAFGILALATYRETGTLGWLLFFCMLSAALSNIAAGGWLGGLVPRSAEGALGAWMIVANISGFGLTAIFAIQVFRAMPEPFGAVLLGSVIALGTIALPFIPAPPPDSRLARESFAQFSIDVASLLKKPEVLISFAMLASPAASFALTNTLGGLGSAFHASEAFVGLAGGIGVTIAGVVGSLMAPPLARRASPYLLYLGIGAVGCLATLALILAPPAPTTFLVAILAENIAQSAAFAVANMVMFRVIGKDNPLAATTFGLLSAGLGIPLVYMQLLDGHAYGKANLTLLYLCDGGLGLLGVAGLGVLLATLGRRYLPRQPA